MKYGLDLTAVEACDQAAGVFCWNGSEVHTSLASLLGDLGHDRQRAVDSGADYQLALPQGTSSSADSGVCPNSRPYGFEGFLLRFRTRPPPMTMSWSSLSCSDRAGSFP